MKLAVLIPAAGASARYQAAGGVRSKLDEDMGGRPLLHRTLDAFNHYDNPDADVVRIAVAGPADDDAFSDFSLRHGDALSLLGIPLVRGAAHRYKSVEALLEHVPDDATHVAVHDAARPCLSSALLDRILAAAKSHPAIVPAIRAGSTLKQSEGEPFEAAEPDPLAGILGDASPRATAYRVARTIPRHDVWLAQTPQVFDADVLKRAYAQGDLSSTDDAELVERLGEPVTLVEGDPDNIKVTHPTDLIAARAIMGLKPPSERPTHKRF